jgi:hypothetical protein
MPTIEPPRCRDQRFEITIEIESRLPLPTDLTQTLGLAPGDLVALEPSDDTLHLRFYRQILTFPENALSPEARWSFLRHFLNFPLTAIDETGGITIPPEILKLPAGAAIRLQITALFGTSWPLVQLLPLP